MTDELKPENFLILERSLSDRLKKRWAAQFAPIKKKLLAAVENDDPFTAHDVIESLDQLAEVHRGLHSYIEYVGTAALLFGASRVRPLRETSLMQGPKRVPPAVKKATKVFENLLLESRKSIKKIAYQMLDKIEHDKVLERDAQLFKADAIRDASFYLDRIQEAGEGTIDITASLHTSRLSSYGFLIEADITEVTSYQIDEVLDSRTCPVCHYMHGKVFTVSRALEKAEHLVEVDDPEELKTLAPFFKQSAENLARLRVMDTDELEAMGMDMPPFHPLCRGLLAVAGTIVEVELTQIPEISPELYERLKGVRIEFDESTEFMRVEPVSPGSNRYQRAPVSEDLISEYEKVMNTLSPEARAIADAYPKPKQVVSTPGSGSYWNEEAKLVASPTGKGGYTVRHEYGHHIDYMTGGVDSYGRKQAWSSLSKEFKEAFAQDREMHGLLSPTAQTPSLNYDNASAVLHHFFTPEDPSKPLTTKLISKFDEWRTMYLSDIADALSLGAYHDDWGLAGHGRRYFARDDADVIETFANMYALHGDPDVWGVILQLAPKAARVFERRLQELVGINYN
jgi:hypothetical protein